MIVWADVCALHRVGPCYGSIQILGPLDYTRTRLLAFFFFLELISDAMSCAALWRTGLWSKVGGGLVKLTFVLDDRESRY